MIPCTRQEVLDTISVPLFCEAKKLLADSRIPYDYSIVYHDHSERNVERRRLYVRDRDYGKACSILCSIHAAG